MTSNFIHKPVMLNETISLLSINPNGTYLDATAGFGGHSQAILNSLNKSGKLICIDQDENAINALEKRFAKQANVKIVKSNFVNLQSILKEMKITKLDGILADLGVSSLMLDDQTRGFSYHKDAPLDMRMSHDQDLDAYKVVNSYSTEQLAKIFKEYGEALEAKAVASAISKARESKPINTTFELVDIIKSAVSKKTIFKHKHPARIYFQAIRIEVNNELTNLNKFLIQATDALKVGGRLAVISFHSLEDRIVKNTFNQLSTSNLPKEIPVMDTNIQFKLLTKHPIIPSEKEVESNFRAHSAKLRGIERIKA